MIRCDVIMGVTVKEVVTREEMDVFVRFPHLLYNENPYWVPAIVSDEVHTLSPRMNPAYENCRAHLWLAYRNGEVTGRIAGIIEKTGRGKKSFARFGWIDFIDDYEVSGALLATVEAWASKHALRRIRGPMGFTAFDPEGMLIEGFDRRGLMSTIYNFPYYVDHLRHHAYRRDASWIEYEVDIPLAVPERIVTLSQYVTRRYGLAVAQVQQPPELLDYAEGIFRLIKKVAGGRAETGFIGERQLNFVLDQFFTFIDPDFVSIVVDKDNRVQAFAMSMPSLTDALRKSGGKIFPFGWYHFYKAFRRNSVADLYLMAVDPSRQNQGLSALLIEDLILKFNKHRIKKAYTHPISESNLTLLQFWKKFGPVEFRRRCCFTKAIHRN